MSLQFHTILELVPPLLLLQGLFSGSEIALLSADRLTLRQQQKLGLPGSRTALELNTHPERVLSTTLFMTSICVITISALVTLYLLPLHLGALAVVITSPLVVILGELLPKVVYQRNANTLARRVAPLVHGTYWIFFPITRVLSSYTHKLSRMVGPIEELLTGKKRSTREELQALLSYGKRESDIKASEKRMIKRIFDFKNAEAKHALIPLVRVEVIPESATVQEALERYEQHRHSRMPVYSGRVDNIVGVLEAADLLSATDLRQPIRHYITSAHYVAETQALDDLLLQMHREDNEVVVVVDEHGGAVGILTFEDIVEEIVGEIHDEYDSETKAYKELTDTSWLVQARMDVGEINEKLELELPQGEYETLSGFLLQQFGRIPENRDELFFNTQSGALKFTIRKATERHIETVLIEKIKKDDPESP